MLPVTLESSLTVTGPFAVMSPMRVQPVSFTLPAVILLCRLERSSTLPSEATSPLSSPAISMSPLARKEPSKTVPGARKLAAGLASGALTGA